MTDATRREETPFEALAERLVGAHHDVSLGRALSQPGLLVDGKLFGYFHRGALVLKLPADLCDELVAGGCERMKSGDRVMREWVVLQPEQAERWPLLAEQALQYVRP